MVANPVLALLDSRPGRPSTPCTQRLLSLLPLAGPGDSTQEIVSKDPSVAKRAQRYLDHLAIQRILRLPDAKERLDSCAVLPEPHHVDMKARQEAASSPVAR